MVVANGHLPSYVRKHWNRSHRDLHLGDIVSNGGNIIGEFRGISTHSDPRFITIHLYEASGGVDTSKVKVLEGDHNGIPLRYDLKKRPEIVAEDSYHHRRRLEDLEFERERNASRW